MNANEVSDIIYENIWDSIQYSVTDAIHVHVRDKIWTDVWYSVQDNVEEHVRNNTQDIHANIWLE